mmetsp:Transcript_26466/g.72763  ORF Transcript_26466/g.72763 Transcript_26466/m.72763 type:complete len:442 (-) Transcript_26466:603-1928(-)|eukprot:CAMPEP_0172368830 /NCGR_PEP_ID=MMETSP1060-20121228/29594_1 /TAXON_ID=37318 /ORGANISM="Pseudo-nitzschia pungens, Strain cf. cingulata" /LENGTH=441 /DNA_ID=CAMNT_0013093567 /DNA_START=50 /DNA_END=1375 /DNA_ORIENTATION=-
MDDCNGSRQENNTVCIQIPATSPCVPDTTTTAGEDDGAAAAQRLLKSRGTCCFLMKYGVCNPRNPPCRFYHPPEGEVVDDGISPCAFGLACRQGHAKRIKKKFANKTEKDAYWTRYYGYDSGESPAVRDANVLGSQLEPWPTSDLRKRLVEDFGESFLRMDPLDRKSLLERLLKHYRDREDGTINTTNLPVRNSIRVQGETPVPPDLCGALLAELKAWRQKQGNVNTRPSIRATSYLILRAPSTEQELKLQKQKKKEKEKQGEEDGEEDGDGPPMSKRAFKELKKLERFRSLWDLATEAIQLVKPHDPEFLESFSALAITYGFRGSPHIDKQNTGPFYGLSLGDFGTGEGGGSNSSGSSNECVNGGGCVCVEADAFTVAHVSTHNCLAKCDGRYPHWVSNYEGERYSLIYYATSTSKNDFIPPSKAFYGRVLGAGEELQTL